ncbi:helix-turn-helix domain-containing protein [Maribacter halichondriae]|uniref:helix-turn-helix domain-containing protein n=1 Tax=Maribacter halichondriae TaxID=2980554 RepID=UPI00235A353A|nr:AraC family transcriptional regulator [Maribacter sp. Hal144]
MVVPVFSALAVIYVGIMGYFTDTTILKGLAFNPVSKEQSSVSSNRRIIPSEDLEINPEIEARRKTLLAYMEREKPYLNPELNLKDLASSTNMTRAQLSEIINQGFNKNFNDFVNDYRVESFKRMLETDKQQQLSFLGMAYECGFNSKATFNRVFKKLSDTSPSEYLKSIR